MKQEDKKLLIRYLCMALPYRVVIDYGYNAFDVHKGNYIKQGSKCLLNCNLLDVFISPRQNEKGEYIKPYLRPMSSMTVEEEREYGLLCFDVSYYDKDTPKCSFKLIKWLLEKHFDFLELIPKGLAIEIT